MRKNECVKELRLNNAFPYLFNERSIIFKIISYDIEHDERHPPVTLQTSPQGVNSLLVNTPLNTAFERLGILIK